MDERYLALTFALRKARAIVSKYERFCMLIEAQADKQPRSGTSIAAGLAAEARDVLKDIDEALK
jgi:hypothetical protein